MATNFVKLLLLVGAFWAALTLWHDERVFP